MKQLFRLTLTSLSMLALGLTACEGVEIEEKFPTSNNREGDIYGGVYEEPESIFGEGGLFSTKRNREESGGSGSAIGVNTYLWRAALDTISFMPIASADPFGGTILTDYYEDPDTKGERYKLTVLILDRELKADGIRVRVFKQEKKGSKWQDAKAPETMARDLENAILTRARQMRTKKLGPLG